MTSQRLRREREWCVAAARGILGTELAEVLDAHPPRRPISESSEMSLARRMITEVLLLSSVFGTIVLVIV